MILYDTKKKYHDNCFRKSIKRKKTGTHTKTIHAWERSPSNIQWRAKIIGSSSNFVISLKPNCHCNPQHRKLQTSTRRLRKNGETVLKLSPNDRKRRINDQEGERDPNKEFLTRGIFSFRRCIYTCRVWLLTTKEGGGQPIHQKVTGTSTSSLTLSHVRDSWLSANSWRSAGWRHTVRPPANQRPPLPVSTHQFFSSPWQ